MALMDWKIKGDCSYCSTYTIHSHYLYCHFMLMRHTFTLVRYTQFVPLSCQKKRRRKKRINTHTQPLNGVVSAFYMFYSTKFNKENKMADWKLVYIVHMVHGIAIIALWVYCLLNVMMWPSFNIWFGASDFSFSTYLPTQSIFSLWMH